MEKVLQELFWAHFFGRPYRSNGIKMHLGDALLNIMGKRMNFCWTNF